MSKAVVHFLWGQERYLIDKRINEIIAELYKKTGEEPEVVPVDADEMTALELGQTLEYNPLFALSRVVIINNPSWLGKSGRKARKIEESLQVLQDYCQYDSVGQVLIITCPERNATNPINKFLGKNAQAVNIKALDSRALEEWCKSELEQREMRAVPAALNRIANSGQDMYYLHNMFDKLSLLDLKQPLTVPVIEEHLDSKQEIKVFKLTDALLNRNIKLALAAFYQLQEQGEHHLLLLHMITQQFLALSQVKFYQELGYTRSKIVQGTGMKDFVVKKMMDKSVRFTSSEIRSIFEKLLAADTSFKRESKDPRIIMEALLVEICW